MLTNASDSISIPSWRSSLTLQRSNTLLRLMLLISRINLIIIITTIANIISPQMRLAMMYDCGTMSLGTKMDPLLIVNWRTLPLVVSSRESGALVIFSIDGVNANANGVFSSRVLFDNVSPSTDCKP